MFENAEAAITYLLNISEEEFFRNFTFKDNALEEYTFVYPKPGPQICLFTE